MLTRDGRSNNCQLRCWILVNGCLSGFEAKSRNFGSVLPFRLLLTIGGSDVDLKSVIWNKILLGSTDLPTSACVANDDFPEFSEPVRYCSFSLTGFHSWHLPLVPVPGFTVYWAVLRLKIS